MGMYGGYARGRRYAIGVDQVRRDRADRNANWNRGMDIREREDAQEQDRWQKDFDSNERMRDRAIKLQDEDRTFRQEDRASKQREMERMNRAEIYGSRGYADIIDAYKKGSDVNAINQNFKKKFTGIEEDDEGGITFIDPNGNKMRLAPEDIADLNEWNYASKAKKQALDLGEEKIRNEKEQRRTIRRNQWEYSRQQRNAAKQAQNKDSNKTAKEQFALKEKYFKAPDNEKPFYAEEYKKRYGEDIEDSFEQFVE